MRAVPHYVGLLSDEPSELPLEIQRELIPPLDAKVFRTVATSQRDLRVLVNQGAFRESLYFRLAAGATVTLPPLRDRLSDRPLLLAHFLGAEHAAPATPALLGDLARVPWTSNVRELQLYSKRLRATDGEARDFPEAAEAPRPTTTCCRCQAPEVLALSEIDPPLAELLQVRAEPRLEIRREPRGLAGGARQRRGLILRRQRLDRHSRRFGLDGA